VTVKVNNFHSTFIYKNFWKMWQLHRTCDNWRGHERLMCGERGLIVTKCIWN